MRHEPEAPGAAPAAPALLCSGFLQRGRLNSPKDQLLPQVNPPGLEHQYNHGLPSPPASSSPQASRARLPALHAPSRSGFPHMPPYTPQSSRELPKEAGGCVALSGVGWLRPPGKKGLARGCFGLKLDRIGSLSGLGC
uniref:Natriuretic peptide C n=1 Tax=Crocodylus porosus TaxID=8502 RepID=A0A7M4F1Y7_CROPO